MRPFARRVAPVLLRLHHPALAPPASPAYGLCPIPGARGGLQTGRSRTGSGATSPARTLSDVAQQPAPGRVGRHVAEPDLREHPRLDARLPGDLPRPEAALVELCQKRREVRARARVAPGRNVEDLAGAHRTRVQVREQGEGLGYAVAVGPSSPAPPSTERQPAHPDDPCRLPIGDAVRFEPREQAGLAAKRPLSALVHRAHDGQHGEHAPPSVVDVPVVHRSLSSRA